MTKYYRIIKDHPTWETGSIISNEEDSEQYRPVDEVFVKDIEGITGSWYEGNALVENQPEWFERVYPIGALEKMVFGNKKQAQAAAAALYKG